GASADTSAVSDDRTRAKWNARWLPKVAPSSPLGRISIEIGNRHGTSARSRRRQSSVMALPTRATRQQISRVARWSDEAGAVKLNRGEHAGAGGDGALAAGSRGTR